MTNSELRNTLVELFTEYITDATATITAKQERIMKTKPEHMYQINMSEVMQCSYFIKEMNAHGMNAEIPADATPEQMNEWFTKAKDSIEGSLFHIDSMSEDQRRAMRQAHGLARVALKKIEKHISETK